MITERKLLDVYDGFRSELRSWGNFRTLFDALPKDLRDSLTSEGRLLPRQCSVDVIRQLYLERLEAIQPAFTLDEFSTPAVNLISCRVAKSDDFEKLSPTYDNDKGIMLLGPIGSGKTLLMQGLIEVARYFDPMSTFRILPTYALTEEFARNGVDVYSRCRVGSSEVNPSVDGLVLDDMGAEAIMNHYGQPTNVIAELILRRYDQRAQTFGTSNLDQKTLRRFYGERVWSRMKSMFNFIEIKGNDRRPTYVAGVGNCQRLPRLQTPGGPFYSILESNFNF